MIDKNLIVMLTWHDVTVANAKELFVECRGAAATHWGFKIEGTTPESMAELIGLMKQAGKRTYIEVLAIDEPTCLKSAQLCAQCGADHLLGTLYYESVHRVCKEAGIAYSPFVALDPDTRLRAPIGQVVEAVKEAEAKGVDGINLSAFRYLGGDPEELLAAVSGAVEKPFSIAGSVNSFERIDYLKTLPMLGAFTIGGAFFENQFGGSFAEQIDKVCAYLKN